MELDAQRAKGGEPEAAVLSAQERRRLKELKAKWVVMGPARRNRDTADVSAGRAADGLGFAALRDLC